MPSKRGLLTTVAYQLKGQPPVCENTMTHTSIRVLRNGMVLCTVRVGKALHFFASSHFLVLYILGVSVSSHYTFLMN